MSARCANPRCACGGTPRVVTVDGVVYTAHHLRDRWSEDGITWSSVYDVEGVGQVQAPQDMLGATLLALHEEASRSHPRREATP